MIIAVDFDGTVCDDEYPNIGKPHYELIKKLIEKSKDNILVLWTCRCGEKLSEAVDWCSQFGLKFNYINETPEEHRRLYDTDPRKIFADVYIDDHCVHWTEFE